jgi:hypothetical protein
MSRCLFIEAQNQVRNPPLLIEDIINTREIKKKERTSTPLAKYTAPSSSDDPQSRSNVLIAGTPLSSRTTST